MLSKEQFYDLIRNLVNKGFSLSSLAVSSRYKLTKDKAYNWLSKELSGYPPYYSVLYSKDRLSYVKIYSSGLLLSNFPIETFIIDFIKNIYFYKRIKRLIPLSVSSDLFENAYFSLNYSSNSVQVLLKSRFESSRSYWLANRRNNFLYLVEDELIILRDLCKIMVPENIECYFNLPPSEEYVFNPISKPGVRPLFKGKIDSDDFIDQVEVLISKQFPRKLIGLKSFILPEDSKITFCYPKRRFDSKGIELLFEDLREYCFDSFHLTDSFHIMNT